MAAIRKVKGEYTVFSDPEKKIEGTIPVPGLTFSPKNYNEYKQTGPEGEDIETQIKNKPGNPKSQWE